MPGANVGMININEMLGKAFGNRTKQTRLNVRASYEILIDEESDKLLDPERVKREAIDAVEQNGIVFSTRSTRSRPAATCAAVTSAAKACSAICCR